MIYLDSPCDLCKHIRPLIDGWKMACEAFPDGFPKGFILQDITKLPECANGIGYEPREE